MKKKPPTVLLVDDQPVILEVGRGHLEKAGFRVETGVDGPTALECLERQAIDLVLLDIVMPGMDGLEVLANLRGDPRTARLPVIMATARQDSADMVRAFDLGANDYVTKPLDWAVVVARVRAHLRSREEVAEATSASPAETLTPGAVVDGRYHLEALLGRGSQGTVWRALDREMRTPVAVKLLNTGRLADSDVQERFRREALTLCRLNHPHAVEIKDLCTDSHGVPFFVMELLTGHTLEDELQHGGRLSLRRTAEILEPACAALATAHRKGILHRDIKPSNVFLHRQEGIETVKILDFGVARLVGAHSLEQRLTNTEVPPGTPAYMAPERFSAETYDGRVDVYSLGVMLYEMLTGALPFSVDDGNILRLIRLHATSPPRPLRELRPDLPPAVEAVVLAALSKDPQKRPTAYDLGQSLQRTLVESPRSTHVRETR